MPHDQESGPDSKIVDIKKAKKDRRQTTVPIMHNVRAVVEAMLFNPHVTMPEFPHRLYVSEDQKGDAIIYQENDGGVVSMISDEKAIGLVSKYCQENCKYEHGMEKINYAHAGIMFKMWRARAPRLPADVADVRQLSEPGLTFSRLNFDFRYEQDQCPIFLEFLNRMGNNEAFCIWVGSLFDPKSYSQQYVWLHGGGKDGKSSFGEILMSAFGTAAASTEAPNDTDKFWSSSIINKRLVMFNEIKKPDFVTSSTFKRLTGGDYIPIEIKNGPYFSVKMRAKYIFMSNDKPKVSDSSADQRRLIYCTVSNHAMDEDPTYASRFAAEAPWIFGHCWRLYLERCGPNAVIVNDKDEALALSSVIGEFSDIEAEKYSSAFECYFYANGDPESVIQCHEFQSCFRSHGINGTADRKRFYDFIAKKYLCVRCENGARGTRKGHMVKGVARNPHIGTPYHPQPAGEQSGE